MTDERHISVTPAPGKPGCFDVRQGTRELFGFFETDLLGGGLFATQAPTDPDNQRKLQTALKEGGIKSLRKTLSQIISD